jgi:hypothetical protein
MVKGMVSSAAVTPEEYITHLPAERRETVQAIVDVVRRNLPPGYEEGMQYGMIGWFVPLARFPQTYNGQPLGLAAIANQKHHVSLYLNNVYGDPETEHWFREAYAGSGKRLEMGKSCVRIRRLDEVPLEVIGAVIARTRLDAFVARYEAVRGSSRRARHGED